MFFKKASSNLGTINSLKEEKKNLIKSFQIAQNTDGDILTDEQISALMVFN